MKNRTALCNETRGILAEFGISIPKGPSHIKRTVAAILNETIECRELSENLKLAIADLNAELTEIEQKIKKLDRQIERMASGREDCKRLLEIPGVGILTATALLAKMPHPGDFKNGRQFAAYLGLVPRHEGTGGKNRNLGLSKRGDRYLRTLMVHGARSIIRIVNLRTDNTSLWVGRLKEKKGTNRAAIALANKNARIAWRLLARGENYNSASACSAPNEAANG
jgi:transposase